MKCEKCHNKLSKNSKFCKYCGEKVNIPKLITIYCMDAIISILIIILAFMSVDIASNQEKIINVIVTGIILFRLGLALIVAIILYLHNIYTDSTIKMLNGYFRIIFISIFLIICSISVPLCIINFHTNNTAINDINKEKNTNNAQNSKIENNDIKSNDVSKEIKKDNLNTNSNFDIMVSRLMSLGFNEEEATNIKQIFNQMGINSISDINSGSTNPDINGLVSYVAIANYDSNQKFYFTIENRKMFYVGFRNVTLYDSEKGGVLRNINNIYIP